MKRYNYFWAETLTQITGIVFITQFLFEISGVITRKPGFEWVIYASGVAFGLSILYLVILITLNAAIEDV